MWLLGQIPADLGSLPEHQTLDEELAQLSKRYSPLSISYSKLNHH